MKLMFIPPNVNLYKKKENNSQFFVQNPVFLNIFKSALHVSALFPAVIRYCCTTNTSKLK